MVEALSAMVASKPRWGFWERYDRLHLDGQGWNHKRVHRVCCAMNLNLPRRTNRPLPNRLRQPLAAPTVPNDIWALDFMADSLYDGRQFRTLNVIDEGDRQALGVEMATSIPARRVVGVLEELIELHCPPRAIRLENCSELTSTDFTEWCRERLIELLFSQLGKPDQNAFIECFNRTVRHEGLDAYVFESLDQVREIVETWLRNTTTSSRTIASAGCRRLPSCRGHRWLGSPGSTCVLDEKAFASLPGPFLRIKDEDPSSFRISAKSMQESGRTPAIVT